jgi:RNA polymerase sigma factor (sigma-70 family)
MSNQKAPRSQSRRRYVVAMVLGTALSLGPAQAATAQAPEPAQQTISDLGRYCATCWRNARLPADVWGDCTQDVFTRLLERVPTTSWGEALHGEGEERRELMRAIDAVKKRTQRARKYTPGVEAVADGREPHHRRLDEDREALRQAADDLLSQRQQRILQLSMEGWSAHDVAGELGIPVERVSDEKYKAIRKLRSRLADEVGAGDDLAFASRLPA